VLKELAVTSRRSGDDVRQCRREPRQDEAVHRDRQQGQGDDRRARGSEEREQRGEHDDDGGADEVAEQQDPLPTPPVEQDPGEGPDDAVRQQQRREAGSRLAGGRRALGVEEDRREQGCLEEPVGELAAHAHAHEAAEVGAADDLPQRPGVGAHPLQRRSADAPRPGPLVRGPGRGERTRSRPGRAPGRCR
jgi:hypothetical protein